MASWPAKAGLSPLRGRSYAPGSGISAARRPRTRSTQGADMFERFTDGARAVVVDALERARGEDAVEVREEHLLAAVLAAPGVRPLLAQLGMSGDPTVSALAEVRGARRRGGLSGVDAHALAGPARAERGR